MTRQPEASYDQTQLDQLTDAELLACYVRGDSRSQSHADDGQTAELREARRQEAFRLLVLRHGGIVMSACRGVLRSEADAEDAFQATFFVLARKAHNVEHGASLASWLHRVAMRIAIRAAKRKQQHKTQPLESAPEAASGELQRVSTQASLMAVHEAIAQLAEPLRGTVLLTYFAGLNRSETAQRLGVTPGAIQARLKKARGQLRRKLALRGTSLAALTVLAYQTSTSIASASMARLSEACANTVFHVQAGLAANSAGSIVSQTLAHGVIRSMTINATLRHALVVAFALSCVWLTFGSSTSHGGAGNAAEAALPLAAADLQPGEMPTHFISAPAQDDQDDIAQEMDKLRRQIQILQAKLAELQQSQKADSRGDGPDELLASPGEAAWGKGVKGLQAGVRLKDKNKSGPYNFGDKVEIEFVIRNVGENVIEFESAEWREDDQMFVKDLGVDGAAKSVGQNWYSGMPIVKRHKLEPGDEVVIDSGPIGIGGGDKDIGDFEHPVVYVPSLSEGRFSGWFQLRLPDIGQPGKDQGWEGTLTTGNLEFEVRPPGDGRNLVK